ncbi:maltotransferase domain-containing protein [Aeromicrobium sp. Leaf291]|uniref:maltotransferase domain-containing protein n=1 Tax=Aeromicrobium sp. Leaf291 TaxID=1736325 RepID=UPI0009EB56B3|nr:maltotransferase domain-containing protein [Aeromicrobium sp. Leaf291]
MVARVPVLEVRPCLDRGRFPAKVVPGEPLRIEAIVLPDDLEVGAAVVLTDPEGKARAPIALRHLGDHLWSATVTTDVVGDWTYHVESWQEPLRSWAARVVSDIDGGADAENVLAHGSALVLGIGDRDPAALQVAEDLLDDAAPAHERLAEALAYVASLPDEIGRLHVDSTDPLPLRVDPERALVGAWYELSPTSTSDLATVTEELARVAALGFDVVRLPPLHPSASANPWDAGPATGEHTSVDPRLGTVDDVLELVEQAHHVGLEVALELAWTISSSHPWLAQHPSWFVPAGDDTWRFDHDGDTGATYAAVLDMVTTWIGRGISAFVVQDAHRWPLALWEQLLHDVRVAAPDVVLVAEGDPSPAQAHALSLVGFHQTTPPLHRALGVHDVEEVLTGIGRGSVTRPQLLASTRHRRSSALTGGSAATFQAWAAVAALGGPAWGVSSTFSPTDDPADETVAAFLTRLNELRRSHPALRSRRGLELRPVHHAGVLAFSRTCADDEVLVVIDLFPAFSKTVGVQTTLTGSDGRLQDELDGSWHAAESILLDLEHPVRVLTGRR